MKLPLAAHTSLPWRIHELARDFSIEDVWELPTPGDRDDFALLVHGFAEGSPSGQSSVVTRALFAIRWRIGGILGWDSPDHGVDSRVPTLRDRLPPDLRDGPRGPRFAALPFTPVYLTGDEFAAEIANKTMHGILHLGWVPDGAGTYRGQMAVLVKPNGVFGTTYMAAIRPFRRLIVYPALIKAIGQRWETRRSAAEPDT